MRAGRIQVFQFALSAPAVRKDSRLLPASSRNGTTMQPLKCSWPLSRHKPSCVSRERNRSPSFAVFLRQPQPQRAVGKTDLKMVNELVVIQAPARQIGARRRRLLQPFVVVAHDLAKQRRVVGLGIERTRQTRHGGLSSALHRLRR